MEWGKLLSTARLGAETETTSMPGGRTSFEADVDRVMFSGAFRRLSRKTQVHPLAANDHVHTRLTHSLEVAQVGRALGKAIWPQVRPDLPSEILASDLGTVVQAACLAHDIGNPPFGHAGEEAMAHWFETHGSDHFRNLSKDHKRDLTYFEGNAQGFRILTQTENHIFAGGLRLTYATLGTFLKYPWSSRAAIAQDKRKFGAYISEEEILDRIAKKLGLISVGKHAWCRHPLAYLVEAADDICYAIIDLEDAVELKILSYAEVAELLLSLFERDEKKRISESLVRTPAHRVNLARLRGPVFDHLIQAVVDAFSKGYDAIMAGQGPTDLFGVLDGSHPARLLVAEAKRLTRTEVFPDSKKVETEIGSYETLGCLLAAFCEAGTDVAEHLKSPTDESPLTWKSGRILLLLGDHAPTMDNAPPGSSWSHYQCLRRVTDYVSGMTDNYATYIAQQLRGMGFAGMQRP